MAEIFKSALINLDTVGNHEVHAVTDPEVVLSLILSNNHEGTVPVSVWVTRNGEDFFFRRAIRIDSGDSLDVLRGTKVALLAGDTLNVSSPIQGAVSGFLSTYKDE